MTAESARQSRRRKIVLAIAFVVGGTLLPAAFATVGGKSAPNLVGELAARHSDDFARGRSTVEFVVRADGKTTPIRVSAREAAPLLGKRVRVGYRADGTAELAADGGSSTGTTGAAATAAGTTEKRIAVILLNFTNDTRQPWTTDQVRSVAFDDPTASVAAYYRAASWGKLSLSGDVFGWFTIPYSTTAGCDYSAWATAAENAATAAGADLSTYQHVVYAFPWVAACGWSGLAYLPGRQSWLNNSGTTLRTMAHELGHNFGTHHASALSCTVNGVRVSLAASASDCTASEYGDPWSVMGAASKHEHTNFSRGNFGWLQSANTLTVTASGEYTLKPIAAYDPTGVQALRVKRTASSYLTLELRQNDGSYFDSFPDGDPVVTGVSTRITSEYSNPMQSQLVDATPGTTSFGDAPLAAGKTLTDPATGISITTLSVSSTGATVRIALTPDGNAPSQPGGLTATALDTSRVSLAWAASSDNVGIAGYRVLRGGTVVATVTGTGYTDTGLAANTTYGYQVVAFDAAGNASTAASASATTAGGGDAQAPNAPAGLAGSLGKGKKAHLSWSGSSDNVGVAGYRIYRNGSAVGTTSGTTYVDAIGGRNPTASYYVVAFDASGNVSPPSNSITVG